jgi:hypothetical protein
MNTNLFLAKVSEKFDVVLEGELSFPSREDRSCLDHSLSSQDFTIIIPF